MCIVAAENIVSSGQDMIKAALQKNVPRRASISIFVLLGFLTLFTIYYNPNISFICHSEDLKSAEEGTGAHPSGPNGERDLIQIPDQTPDLDTILLIWMWPYGNRFETHSCGDFNIQGCHLTDDRNLYKKANGVLFHHRDILRDLSNMPQDPRPWFQKWVWLNAESPANSEELPELDNLFNLTTTYRQDSSIPVPCGHLAEVTGENNSFELPPKDKLVCWIVSNWNSNFARVQVFNELKNHVKVATYGKHFGRLLQVQDYEKIIPECKFYLSFENSVYKDYITEKLYNAMRLGTVPVVLGPSRQNYEDFIPGDSFIHVDDFPNLKELADRLLFLDKNDDEYMKYHSWRKNFRVKGWYFGLEHACRSCDYIRRNKIYKSFNNLNKWYWG